jgi:hypothetical protein
MTVAAGALTRDAQNSIFVEAFGSGLLYSVNYDRIIRDRFSVRIGLGYLSDHVFGPGHSWSMLSIPLMGNLLLGRTSHRLELGAGVTFVRSLGENDEVGSNDPTRSEVTVVATANVGYRYCPTDGGFNFRAGFTPLLNASGFLPWGGISLGYGF